MIHGNALATLDDKVSSKQTEEMLKDRIYLVALRGLKREVEAYKPASNVISSDDLFTD
jgi:hypothetical protein